jgi:hypothetical protein
VPPPDANRLHAAARDLRSQVTAIRDARSAYDIAHDGMVWDGPGRDHLDAYQKPALAALDDVAEQLGEAAAHLDRAAEDLVRRVRDLRTDEQNVRARLPRYFEDIGYQQPQIARYLLELPPSEDPRWADFARTVVGHSVTGR